MATNLSNQTIDISGLTPEPDGSVNTKELSANQGGDAALSWSQDGSGNTIITTDGTYNFGTKPQAAPVLWAFGSEIYENGVLNASEGTLDDGDAYLSATMLFGPLEGAQL